MEQPITHYWNIRLGNVKEALEANNFEAFVVESAAEAKRLVLEEILPAIAFETVSWGGSMTLKATGLREFFLQESSKTVLDPNPPNASQEEKLEQRRKTLLADLYLTGTNAVTEAGQLVNLDMIGNRVGAITFGPKHVIIVVGRNKIVPDLESAMYRIKDYAAPINAMRLDMKTPCVISGTCEECKSPRRICNSWTITEKSFPNGRIRVILINEELGY